MKSIHLLFLVLLCIYPPILRAQSIEVYPPHWWTGMKNNTLQLLIKATDPQLGKSDVSIQHQGISISNVHRLENGKYLAIDIAISSDAVPGNAIITFKSGKKTQKVNWPLKSRDKDKVFAQGVTSSDFIYLAMPDRFSNGNPLNDKVKGMRDQSLNRDSIFHRHGGDLQGLINHLDYLQDLGVTTLWLTPVLENDMPDRTEHGYAITNHYKVDPRHGGAELYKKLSDELHKRNMKLIQDAVYNHVGLYHFFAQDKPTSDWLHEWPSYTNTTYKDQPLMDIHASKDDQRRMSDGWFTRFMPDLNQHNPYVANFLIQHALWSVEEFSIDGWRIDTYIYNDLDFMNHCNQALLDEYPNISLFGETWVHGVAAQAYFARNTFSTPFKSNLPGVTDFQTNLYGIMNAVNEPFGWTNGVNKLYQTLASDFVYEDAMRNVNFLDNHDMSRFYSVVNEDLSKYKMGLAWLLTCRGIPQMYYGTEVLMKGISNPDGWVRLDFPGGWPGDKVNKFTKEGRTEKENEAFEWTKKLANFRKNSSAIKTGKMMQYVPEDGVYVYFRYDDNQTVMCVMNTQEKPMTIDTKRFAERIKDFKQGREVATDIIHNVQATLSIPQKYMLVLELK
ncbi:glycoside hydrolase family 13 protein [Ohtaekwangia koreensis]|uniref:Glycosidase n=1 Tax=Ohtaekwangia koreensis TaxID=688867 RepID=A0A1T5KBZ0_9BACT|nr:glycoside hydrolase family 13 protein [Ohtaekwangia koreensis]SKC61233.1 Glycosidase [Ohtaekwangia koreensis]